MKIYTEGGALAVEYIYDTWGTIVDISVSTGYQKIADANCLLYRGYYYDFETGYYYLNSRYYDPQVKRFISPDRIVSMIGGNTNGYNLYSYCFNNPIMYRDSNGNWPTKEEFKEWWNTSWSEVCESYNQLIDGLKSGIVAVADFVDAVNEDLENLDVNNTSEEKVLEANYVSSYNGVSVYKLPIGSNAFSFGAIFIGTEVSAIDIKHEYGHSLQFQEIGIENYTRYVAVPSLRGYWSKIHYNEYYSQPWEYGADLYGNAIDDRKKSGYVYSSNAYENYMNYWSGIQ